MMLLRFFQTLIQPKTLMEKATLKTISVKSMLRKKSRPKRLVTDLMVLEFFLEEI